MLETIKILQQTIEENKKEIAEVSDQINATQDKDDKEWMWDRINILVGENRAYYHALGLLKRDFTEARNSIHEFEPRLEVA